MKEDLKKETELWIEKEITGVNPIYTAGAVGCIINNTARHFTNWQKEQTINKARKWLAGNVINYIWKGSGGGIGIRDDFFIDFEKAMEDE